MTTKPVSHDPSAAKPVVTLAGIGRRAGAWFLHELGENPAADDLLFRRLQPDRADDELDPRGLLRRVRQLHARHCWSARGWKGGTVGALSALDRRVVAEALHHQSSCIIEFLIAHRGTLHFSEASPDAPAGADRYWRRTAIGRGRHWADWVWTKADLPAA